ncbi:MAG: hypothetical protein M1541_14820, partial [Acidobacteria bacterium]|nr:hypothetical protein [Acidobacteriota bacterium]
MSGTSPVSVFDHAALTAAEQGLRTTDSWLHEPDPRFTVPPFILFAAKLRTITYNRIRMTGNIASKAPTDGRRKPFTDEERRTIALLRYRPVQGRLITWQTIGEMVDREPRLLHNVVDQAFERGLVKVVEVVQRPIECSRDRDLELDLRDAFPKLEKVIVVNSTPLIRNTATGSGSESAELQKDDLVHRALGVAMAKEISDGLIFRANSVIGVGAGRGVYYTLEALAREHSLPYSGVTILSLTGAVHAQDYLGTEPVHLDADTHALLLTMCFRPNVSVSVQYVKHAITNENLSRLENSRRQTILDDETWRKIKVTHALVGIGVLARGHRFFEEVQPLALAGTTTAGAVQGGDGGSVLDPIWKDLKRLVDLSRQVGTCDWNPIGDICHHLFYIDPPPSVRVSPQHEASLKQLIEEINGKLLNISKRQLQSIESITIVAGTKRKALAIRKLLRDDSYPISILCTDNTAAG